jgi:hypothetical protein
MGISERELVGWLLDEQFAEVDQDGLLRPTGRCVELGGSVQPLGDLVPA